MDEFAEERAAAGMPAVPVELHRVPFFLEPWYVNQPDDFWETHYTRQTRKFGSVEAFERVKLAHRLMPRAAEAGLDVEGWSDENLDNRRQSSTLRAHRLIRWLDQTLGWQKAEEAYAHLHDAHFVRQKLLNDTEVLVGAAVAAGADADAAADFLRGEEQASTIMELTHCVHEMGIQSIPMLLIGGHLTVSGAAGKDEVLMGLRRAATSSPPSRGRRFADLRARSHAGEDFAHQGE